MADESKDQKVVSLEDLTVSTTSGSCPGGT
jgi:hypothetical protein